MSTGRLKLLERGLPKAHLAALSTAVAPVHALLPLLLARRTADAPWRAFLAAYPARLVLCVAAVALVGAAPGPGSVGEAGSSAWMAALVAWQVAHAVVSQTMFVAQMGAFATVADPAIGGTAMTLYNTAANLGSRWPVSVALFAAEAVHRWRVTWDPFALLTALCTALGALWLIFMSRTVEQMGSLPPASWRVGGVATGELRHSDEAGARPQRSGRRPGSPAARRSGVMKRSAADVELGEGTGGRLDRRQAHRTSTREAGEREREREQPARARRDHTPVARDGRMRVRPAAGVVVASG